MLHNIANILQRECNFHARNLVLVGISGGPDSLCLLHVLHTLGYPVIAGHVNHRLRAEADDDMRFAELFAAQLGVEFVSCQVDVQTFANDHSLSIEEAARTLRYQCLFQQAQDKSASAVAVGHNADDQVETILMHFLRGSGTAGLRGMPYWMLPNPWSEKIPLIRPLLSTRREAIMNYLAEHDIHPVSDQSNLDTTFFRNRLRHELLPFLQTYNPRIHENLLRAGEIMRDDYSVLQQLVDDAWENVMLRQGSDFLVFQRSAFLALHRSIQRNLLRKGIAYHLPGLRDIDFECIERGLDLLYQAQTSGQIDLMAGLFLFKEGNEFWLVSKRSQLPISDYPSISPGEQYTLTVPSTVLLHNGWQLRIEEPSDRQLAIRQSASNRDPFQAWLDTAELATPLIVRSRKAGDRLQPLGMDGHSVKVSDLMINLKLPRRARKAWPLVCSGQEILWIPGYRQSQRASINQNSCSIVYLSLTRKSST